LREEKKFLLGVQVLNCWTDWKVVIIRTKLDKNS
jgi:hypothetical protein